MAWQEKAQQLRPNPQITPKDNTFDTAARARWKRLAEELKADVAAFNAQQPGAEFSGESETVFRVINSAAGLELRLTADFENRNVRYDYSALNQQSAGIPEGGILSMRQSADGAVEFYSADEQLTPKEMCNVLLEPVQFPGRHCA